MHKLLLLSVSTLLAATATGGQARALKWMDAAGAGLPAGAKMAVVRGDPGKAGEFTVQIRMPANYTVPPHHHPTDERVSIVSGGPLAYGMGDKLDRGNAGSLEKGYHINLQSGMNHWVVAPQGGATVQVTAMGPFQITYANPADDPRGAK